MTDCRNWLAYTFSSLSRQTTEKWYNNLTDADVPQNIQKTYTVLYDEAGRVASIGDGDYDLDYTYSILGNLTSTTQDLTGLTDDVEFSYGRVALLDSRGYSRWPVRPGGCPPGLPQIRT